MKAKPKYKFNIYGKNRLIRSNAISIDTTDEFMAKYAGFNIHVTFEEEHSHYDKPWYATCINPEVSFGTAVDGWVGVSKDDAIKVCLENIFYFILGTVKRIFVMDVQVMSFD